MQWYTITKKSLRVTGLRKPNRPVSRHQRPGDMRRCNDGLETESYEILIDHIFIQTGRDTGRALRLAVDGVKNVINAEYAGDASGRDKYLDLVVGGDTSTLELPKRKDTELLRRRTLLKSLVNRSEELVS
ncbi:unnamed protein product [Peronospora farinosa]|uniref:Uncharacterized protein n=1 Tax=Peronospora farinosa TaxID=134698 RepID=A0AAV0SXL8_9STRA|nr:unnamed protein product [Peronospora farinosa]